MKIRKFTNKGVTIQKHSIRLLSLLAVFICLFSIPKMANAGLYTISDTLRFDGAGNCPLCGQAQYACSNNFGNWGSGIKTFTDAVPSGSTVVYIIVRVDYVGNCSGAGNYDVLFNGANAGNVAQEGTCDCQDYCKINTFYPDTADYVYGGTNSIQVVANSATICVSRYEILIVYDDHQGVPPPSDHTMNVTNCFMTVDTGTYVTAGGHILIETAGAIENTGTIEVAKNWTNNGDGLINDGSGTVVLKGTGEQIVGGTSATTFQNLTVNNGTVVNDNVSLADNDITVDGTLAFTKGNIATGDLKVILPSTASATGASTTTGWVNGNLERDFPAGTSSFKYDIGDDSTYAPATLDMNDVTGTVNVTGYVDTIDANEDVPTLNASLISQSQKAKHYWFMSQSGGGSFSTYDITLDFTNTPHPGSTANYVVKRFESTWQETTSSVTGTTIKATGLAAFGDFEAGQLPGGYFTFNAKVYIQGYYLRNGKMSPLLKLLNLSDSWNDADSLTVELHNSYAPYDTSYTTKAIIKTDGTISFALSGEFLQYKHYIVIKHRNSLETWSADSVDVSLPYDFTTAADKAYGNQLVPLGDGSYGLYSGDILSEGSIDGADKSTLQNALTSFPTGVYSQDDITGDGSVDESDYRILQNNIPLVITVQHP